MAQKNVTYKLAGVSEMQRTFKAIADAVGVDGVGTHTDEVKNILMRPAEQVRDSAQAFAPYRSGKLRGAIYAAKGPADKPGVIVAVDTKEAPYAPDVEFGTSKAQAQPFYRPAMVAMSGEFPNNVAAPIGSFIEDVATKAAFHPPEK